MKYMLDANIVSELLRERPDEGVEEAFRQHAKHAAVPAPAYYEIAFGIAVLPDGARKRALSAGFTATTKGLPVVPFGRAAARWLAAENARSRRAGRVTGVLDGQIAAIAAVARSILVTRNVRDFEHHPRLELENWFSASAG